MNFQSYLYLLRYSLAKRGAVKQYRAALANQGLPLQQLEELSWQRTKKLLAFAYDHVPYYKVKYAAEGLHPADIITPGDFLKIPILTRKEVIDHYDDLIADNVPPSDLKFSTTGGSTGTPLKIAMPKKVNREIQKWRMLSWWGLPPSVNIASAYREVPQSLIQKLALCFVNWPSKFILLDATQIDASALETFTQEFIKLKPELLHGYVGAMDAFADYLIKKNIKVPSPKIVWLTAAPITAVQEAKITSVFSAPVCDHYGCSELYFIAAECPHKQGLHVFADACRLEILDEFNIPSPIGEFGKIVFTDLENYAFPLIRYENGDSSKFIGKECSCGLSLPLMDKVKGRISDNIILPDGTVLAGEYLTTIFDEYTDIVSQFQVIQKTDESIEVKVVLKDRANSNQEIKLKRAQNTMIEKIKGKVPLKFTLVDSIENSKGKLRFVVKENRD